MIIDTIDGKIDRVTASLSHQEVSHVDPVTFEIIKNRTNAIVAEMGLSVLRTAHSVLFAESKDFSCAVFDAEGHLVGMAEYLPAHQGQMQSTLDGVIRAVGIEGFKEGDVFMTNDALHGGCHPQDLTVFAPIYWQGTLIGIAGCIVHHVDMGGMAPSSYCPEATELFQEGIRFPPTTKLFEQGRLRQDILNIFLANIRTPVPQKGDLMAQVAGCHTAIRRVLEMVEKYGIDAVRDTFLMVQHYSERRTREMFEALPDGEFETVDYLDGDGIVDRSYKIRCAMTIEGGRATFDLTGSDEQAKGFVNSYLGGTAASLYVAIMCHLPPDVPKNYGIFAPIEIIAEKGTIVNPYPIAPLGACTTESGQVITEVARQCLGKADPPLATGCWGGNLGVHLIWGVDSRTNKSYVGLVPEALGVGGGARATMDGWPSSSSVRGANITIPNVEITEAEYPILYRHRRLPADFEKGGGGPGRYRGGASCTYEIEPIGNQLHYSMILGRYRNPPMGVFGGGPGSFSAVTVKNAQTGEVLRSVPTKVLGEVLELGESLEVIPPSGAGYGSPLERDPQMVLEDVRLGYSSIRSARDLYGVVINPDTLEVDLAATAKLRQSLLPPGADQSPLPLGEG
ncbi:MAG: hydantoinase B/oxoprolinase family protein [Chloroflexi bacterium]|nr:hydantoinase B/oxoprolinase family protein [Chloroflexota bacterium]